jgi:hypothetical protein
MQKDYRAGMLALGSDGDGLSVQHGPTREAHISQQTKPQPLTQHSTYHMLVLGWLGRTAQQVTHATAATTTTMRSTKSRWSFMSKWEGSRKKLRLAVTRRVIQA